MIMTIDHPDYHDHPDHPDHDPYCMRRVRSCWSWSVLNFWKLTPRPLADVKGENNKSFFCNFLLVHSLNYTEKACLQKQRKLDSYAYFSQLIAFKL